MSPTERNDSKESWYQYLTDTVSEGSDDRSQSVDPTASDPSASDPSASDPSADEIPLGEPYNLWDAERGVVVRHVNASWLDTHAQTKDSIDAFLERMKYQHVEELVIHNDRPKCGNPNYRRFSRRSIEAFCTAITMNGIACRIS